MLKLSKNLSLLLLPIGAMTGSLQAQTLEQAVEKALVSNPKISIYVNRYRASVAAVDEARSGFLPSLNIKASYGRESTDSPTSRGIFNKDPVDLTRGEATVTIRQMLFDGFNISSSVDQKSAQRDNLQHAVYSEAEALALKVSSVYLDALKSSKIVALSKANIKSHQQVYDKIASRVEQGVGSAANLSQISGRLSRATASLIAAQHNLDNANARYVSLINTPISDLIEPISDHKMLPLSIVELLANTRQNNPKLTAAQFDIEAKQFKLSSLASSDYPTIKLELSGGFNNNLDGINGHSNEALAMVRLNYDLFTGGRDAARKMRGAYQLNESKDSYKNTLRELQEQGRLAFNSMKSLSLQMEYIQSHVKSSETTHRAYQKQFEINKRTLLDLLDSTNELFEARRSLLELKYNQLYAQYRVLHANGTLLESLRVNRPTL